MTTKMSQQLISHFSATHQHADGGLYEVLDFPRVKLTHGPYEGTWVSGVLYRDINHVLCVRTLENFNERFTKL